MNYFGVNGIDRNVIEKYLNYTNGFFLEVGGNDGITQSNTAHLEFYKEWKGILIEPVNHKFERMKINRPNSICFNSCLSDQEGQVIDFYEVNLMSMVKNSRKSEEEDEKWLIEGENCQGLIRNKIKIKTTKLDTILRLENITKIDFFSLDVEGHELNVLKGMDFNFIRPEYILIECAFREEVFDFMLKNNYENVDKFVVHDYLFVDKLKK